MTATTALCRTSRRLVGPDVFLRRGRAVCPRCGQLVAVEGPEHEQRWALHHGAPLPSRT